MSNYYLGADVLSQLARMRQQLQSERQRVESDLNREQVQIPYNTKCMAGYDANQHKPVTLAMELYYNKYVEYIYNNIYTIYNLALEILRSVAASGL